MERKDKMEKFLKIQMSKNLSVNDQLKKHSYADAETIAMARIKHSTTKKVFFLTSN